MEGQSVIKRIFRKRFKILNGFGRDARIKLQFDFAAVFHCDFNVDIFSHQIIPLIIPYRFYYKFFLLFCALRTVLSAVLRGIIAHGHLRDYVVSVFVIAEHCFANLGDCGRVRNYI